MGFRVKNRNVRQGESGFSDPNEPVFRRKDARYPTEVGFVNTASCGAWHLRGSRRTQRGRLARVIPTFQMKNDLHIFR